MKYKPTEIKLNEDMKFLLMIVALISGTLAFLILCLIVGAFFGITGLFIIFVLTFIASSIVLYVGEDK
jgi:hypothetical protein